MINNKKLFIKHLFLKLPIQFIIIIFFISCTYYNNPFALGNFSDILPAKPGKPNDPELPGAITITPTNSEIITTSINPQISGTVDVACTLKFSSNSSNAEIKVVPSNWILPANSFSTPFGEGVHNVFIEAFGNNGEKGSASIKLHIDLTRPNAIISAVQSYINTKDVTLTISGTDVSSYRYKLNSDEFSAISPVANKIILTDLPEGENTLKVIAIKTNGVEQLEPTIANWIVDTIAPVITFEPKTTSNPKPDLSGTISEKESIITIKIDDKTYDVINHGSGTWYFHGSNIESDLTSGDYDVYLNAIDRAGNDSLEVPAKLTIDTTMPSAVLVNPPDFITNVTDYNFSVSDNSGDIVSYHYSFDGGVWSENYIVSNNINLSSLSEGSHTLLIRGINNVSTEQSEEGATSYVWTIDLTPPEVELIGDPIMYLDKGQPHVEPDPAVTCSDNYDSAPTVIKTGVVNSNTPGTYLINYAVKDKAGNETVVTRKVVIKSYLFDGSVTFDYAKNGISNTATRKEMYIDFDDQFIYFGFKGEEMDIVNKAFYFVANTTETLSEGTIELEKVQWFEGSKVILPFNAKYLYMPKYYTPNNKTLTYKRVFKDSNWGEREYITDKADNQFFEYTASDSFKTSVYAVNRAFIGNPQDKLQFVLYVKNLEGNDNGYGWLFSPSPGQGAEFDGIGTKTFTKYWELDLNYVGNPNNAVTEK